MPKKLQLTALGKFLRKFKAVNNMTADELARDLGISSTLLYKLKLDSVTQHLTFTTVFVSVSVKTLELNLTKRNSTAQLVKQLNA